MNNFSNLPQNAKIFIFVVTCSILYVLYYLIKNFNKIDGQFKIILIFLVTGLIWGISQTFKKSDNFILLKKNYGITSGKVVQYFVPKLKGGVASRGISGSTNYIRYQYEVDDIPVENAYGPNNYVDIPDQKPNLDINYLVIYENGNPKNSFILLNYPINKKDDLVKYRNLFEDKIQDDTFQQK